VNAPITATHARHVGSMSLGALNQVRMPIRPNVGCATSDGAGARLLLGDRIGKRRGQP
jgi:hypothetical protein